MTSLRDTLIELELYCLKPEVRSSRQELEKILADDFMEIPSTGKPYDKSHALSRIPGEISPIFTQQDYEVRILDKGLAQLIYKATIQRPNEESISYSIRNSIWKLNGGIWQMLFHQGTPCEPFKISFNKSKQ
ncbi:DUF4440 domain-containing protein [Endozoicomonas arenosclerae]|uniref:nuclear transport factor 2 family protein n=1 Tax=Endozoicomonas arenosclerae TaxID=1633495 RepID=UPI0007855CAE|nr:DUF4440 domain-containing protein [Endozoicomonas arenosclerae]